MVKNHSLKESQSDDLDLIWGAAAIGEEIGQSRTATYYMLGSGKLPARKVGDKWVAVRSRLREFFLDG